MDFQYIAKFRVEEYGYLGGYIGYDTKEYGFKLVPINRNNICYPDIKIEKFAGLTSYIVTVPVSKNHVKYWFNKLGAKKFLNCLTLIIGI